MAQTVHPGKRVGAGVEFVESDSKTVIQNLKARADLSSKLDGTLSQAIAAMSKRSELKPSQKPRQRTARRNGGGDRTKRKRKQSNAVSTAETTDFPCSAPPSDCVSTHIFGEEPATSKRLLVCLNCPTRVCARGFWRDADVPMTCEKEPTKFWLGQSFER